MVSHPSPLAELLAHTALAGALALLVARAAAGQSTASQIVRIEVRPVGVVQLTGGSVALVVKPQGDQPAEAEDRSGRLDWSSNLTGQKITIASDLVSPHVALRVQALGTRGGTAAGEVQPDGTPRDFITGVSRCIGGCGLRYVVVAPPLAVESTELRTITYTLVDAR